MEQNDPIGKHIHRLARQYGRHFDKALERYGISQIQMRIMGFLFMMEGTRDIFQKDIEREFHIRPSSVSSVLSTMEENGYIHRICGCPDGRLKKLVLTDKARALQSDITRSMQEVESELGAFLSDEERRTLAALLFKLSSAIRDADRAPGDHAPCPHFS